MAIEIADSNRNFLEDYLQRNEQIVRALEHFVKLPDDFAFSVGLCTSFLLFIARQNHDQMLAAGSQVSSEEIISQVFSMYVAGDLYFEMRDDFLVLYKK